MRGLTSGCTTWHITFGTYGARLHGGERLTVDRSQNRVGDDVVERDASRERFERDRMRGRDVVILDREQCAFIEAMMHELCERGGWRLHACAAPPPPPPPPGGDHVHVVLEAPSDVHGKQVRTLLKRWLTQALNERWKRPTSGAWWAEGGSTKAVKNESYLHNVIRYVERQRTTP